ncbi:hypothetical protein H4219_004741 [Mycoemilia scoparia]|uniref:LIM zinc-binding domain-containing protein n=1 Tax=Mycoemilia scoparia TaxID=417184 RepID=A0A9W7ZQM8_9FUNG|nr:hypothetical protein H4219_004741 [Mycoemilia scoparia]
MDNGAVEKKTHLQTQKHPFKYDIRVIGDLYPEDENRSTRVSVKIRGSEDLESTDGDDGAKRAKEFTITGGGGRVGHHRRDHVDSPAESEATYSVRGGSQSGGSVFSGQSSNRPASNSRSIFEPKTPSSLDRGLTSTPKSVLYNKGAIHIATSERSCQSSPPVKRQMIMSSPWRAESIQSAIKEGYAAQPESPTPSSHSGGSFVEPSLVGGGAGGFGRNMYYADPISTRDMYRSASRSSNVSTGTQSSSYVDKMDRLLSHYFRPNELEDYLKELNQRHRFIGRDSERGSAVAYDDVVSVRNISPAAAHRRRSPSPMRPQTREPHSYHQQNEKKWESMSQYKPTPPDMSSAFKAFGKSSDKPVEINNKSIIIDSPFKGSESNSAINKINANTTLNAVEDNSRGAVKRTEGVLDRINEEKHPSQTNGRNVSFRPGTKESFNTSAESQRRYTPSVDQNESLFSGKLRGGGADPGVSEDSLISLPMSISSLPSELAAVINRTGGLDKSKLKKTHADQDVESQSNSVSKPHSPLPQKNISHSELSQVMMRTANMSIDASRDSLDRGMSYQQNNANSRTEYPEQSRAKSQAGLKGGGVETPEAQSDDNELAAVFRKPQNYNPSLSSMVPAHTHSMSSLDLNSSRESLVRPDYGLSEWTQRRAGKAQSRYSSRPGSIMGTPHLRARADSVPRRDTPMRVAAETPASDKRYYGGERAYIRQESPIPQEPSQPYQRPNARQDCEEYNAENTPQENNEEREPSPPMPKPPTPVFGRFPSPPAYIKNRGKEPKKDNSDVEEEYENKDKQPQGQPYNQHSAPNNYQERGPRQTEMQPPPNATLLDRLDLDLRSPQPAGDNHKNHNAEPYYDSASTLMNPTPDASYMHLPKVVDEDEESEYISFAPAHRDAYSKNRRKSSGLRRTNSDDSLATREIFTSEPNRAKPRQSRNYQEEEPVKLRGGGGCKEGLSRPSALSRASFGSEDTVPIVPLPNCHICSHSVNLVDKLAPHNFIVHRQCLCCHTCEEMLTMATYRCYQNKFFCETHFRDIASDSKKPPEYKLSTMARGIAIPNFHEFARNAIETKPITTKFGTKDGLDFMNKAVQASFTSVDDFIRHMREQQQMALKDDESMEKYMMLSGNYDQKRLIESMREQTTTPRGTQWLTDRLIDRELRTKIYEKKYKLEPQPEPTAESNTKSRPNSAEHSSPEQLRGGGRIKAQDESSKMPLQKTLPSNASTTSFSSDTLKNDTIKINGWDQPLCPSCDKVIYPADKMVFEKYAYHQSCFRCRKCKRILNAVSALRVKGNIFCQTHGKALLRRRSNILHNSTSRRRRSGRLEDNAKEQIIPSSKDRSRRRSSRRVSGLVKNGHKKDSEASGVSKGPSSKPDSGAVEDPASALNDFLSAATDQIVKEKGTIENPDPISKLSNIVNTPEKPSFDINILNKPRSPPPKRPESTATSISSVSSPSKSVFRSKNSTSASSYTNDIVNSLREEATRLMEEGNRELSQKRQQHQKRIPENKDAFLSSRGPSIAENMHLTSSADGRVSVSSHFDPFQEETDNSNNESPNPGNVEHPKSTDNHIFGRMRPGPFGPAPPAHFASPFMEIERQFGENGRSNNVSPFLRTQK